MLDISALTAADVGREVYYDGSAGREFGVISTWNDRFVFVRYGSSNWAQGTLPRLLSFSSRNDKVFAKVLK